MMNPITWIKIQFEAAKFGIKQGQVLMLKNPLMPQNEAKIRIALAWADHLKATGRGHLITKPDVIDKMRQAVHMVDMQRTQSLFVPVNNHNLN